MSTQTNVTAGDLRILANEDLTGKEGYVALIVSDSGVAKAALPDDMADIVNFVIIEGAEADAYCVLRPLEPGKQVRLELEGACAPGARLCALVDGTQDGKVQALPLAADDYYCFARAEETGADGQLVLARAALDAEVVTVTE